MMERIVLGRLQIEIGERAPGAAVNQQERRGGLPGGSFPDGQFEAVDRDPVLARGCRGGQR